MAFGSGQLGLGQGKGGLLGGALSPYVGAVATRTWVPQWTTTNNKQFNSQTYHFMRGSPPTIRIGDWNGYAVNATTPDGGEHGVGGSATLRRSISYDGGSTWTQLKYGGASSYAWADNEIVISDPIAAPANYAKFLLRVWYDGAVGVPLSFQSGVSGIGDNTNGDVINLAPSGLTDLTLGGTITNSNPQYSFPPCFIIGATTQPVVGLCGDSIVYGMGDTYFDTSGNIGTLSRSLAPSMAVINVASCGDRVNWAITNYTKRLQFLQYCSHFIVGYGTNDLNNGARTSTQVLADLQTFYAMLPAGKPIYSADLIPRTNSSDGWLTTTNQTAQNAGAETGRVAVNTALRAGVAQVVSNFDLAAQVESSLNSGKFKAPGYTADGTHPAAPANRAIQLSAIIDPTTFKRSGRGVTAALPPLVLDALSTFLHASAYRRIRSGYTGPLIRVQRSNDNAQLDIGANVNGGLDTTALLAFVGANSAVVVKRYDQSGSGNDYAGAGAYPQIVNAGSLNLMNNQVAEKYSGSQILTSSMSRNPVSTQLVSATVFASSLGSTQSILGPSATGGLTWRVDATTGTVRMNKGAVAGIGAATTALPVSTAWVLDATYNGSAYAFFKNGAADGSGTNVQTLNAATCILGGDAIGDGDWNGNIGDFFILDNASVAAARAVLDVEQKSYWGTP